MVGPTRDEVREDTDYGLVKWGFTSLMALSGGTVALQGDASPAVAALAVLAGALVGLALMTYLLWTFR